MNERIADLHGITKSFAVNPRIRQMALEPIDFHVHQSEFVSIIGPSGCGKTTLLRILAGLESVDAGLHECCGKATQRIPPGLGYAFQHNSLFPWLNALENVAFGLCMKGMDKKQAQVIGQIESYGTNAQQQLLNLIQTKLEHPLN